MSLARELQSLVESFVDDVGLASKLESPNEADDLTIKTAIVGFSYHASTSDWGRDHFDFLRLRLESDYELEDLEDYGENRLNIRLFFALCMGYLLGLYQSLKINDEDVRMAEIQIPGVILLHAGRLTEQRIG